MPESPIPKRVIYRLSVYLRCLQHVRDRGVRTISSEKLAAAAGVKPTQIRKDLAYFGQFGTRGLGYDVARLLDALTGLLGTNRLQPVILVGVGNLGTALLAYRGFERQGFEIVAAFDVDTRRRRSRDLHQPLHPTDELEPFLKSNRGIRVAILAVPSAVAQDICSRLVAAGISAILNFAPVILQAPEGVAISNVNLAIELENLAYFGR
jgi:redox-sensing transcriptional repressor